MALNKRTQNELVPGFSNGLFFKDLIDWPYAGTFRNEPLYPAVNVKESEDHFELELAAPGLQKNDFSIEIDKNILSISYTKKEESGKEGETSRFTLREFNLKSFKRSFKLPENKIETEKVEAAYTNGVLSLILPKKAEKTEKIKQIQVM